MPNTALPRRRVRAWLAVALLVLVGSNTLGCSFPVPAGQGRPYQGAQGPGHRPQALALTPRQELSLGTQAYQVICAKYPVVESGRDAERVRAVGRKIRDAAQIRPLQLEI